MEHLDISYCNALNSNDIFEHILKYYTKISSLKLVGLVKIVDDTALEYIGKLTELTEIDLTNCNKITDKGLEHISQMRITETNSETINNATIEKRSSSNALAYISKKTMIDVNIIPESNKFTNINLSGCIKLTGTAINNLIKTSTHSLTHLDLSLLPQKTVGYEISDQISKCKKLQSIDLSGCINLTDSDISSIFSGNFDNLKSINLSGIIKLTDSGATSLMNSCKNLTVLRLSNCPNITKLVLEYLNVVNLNLLVLEINRTPLISDSIITETIKLRAPNLRIIRATNIVWHKEDIGYRIPLMPKDYVKPLMKGAKKPAVKKNDDKNPINQLKKILEERKPKRAVDFKI